MNLGFYICLGTLTLTASADPVHVTDQFSDNKVIVRADLDHGSVSLSDRIVLTLTIEGPGPVEVETIKAVTPSKAWVIERPVAAPESVAIGDDRSRWRQVFTLSPLQPGEVTLPIAPIHFRTSASPDLLEWKPSFTVKISTVVLNNALTELRDIRPPEEVPPILKWPWASIALTLIGLVGGVPMLVWAARRFGRRVEVSEPALPADRWALREIAKIEAEGLPEQRQTQRYHASLADLIRRYLDRRFGLHSEEQTTAELLTSLNQSTLGAEHQEMLRSFLNRCDLAKFAQAEYSSADCRLSGRLAREFVEQTAMTTPSLTPG